MAQLIRPRATQECAPMVRLGLAAKPLPDDGDILVWDSEARRYVNAPNSGPAGPQGDDGLSAYEVAVLNGFSGSEAAWLLSLIGPAPCRTVTIASSATPAINVDVTDEFTITALAVAITSMTTSLTGTPVNGQKLIVRILDNGSPRAITWGASFAARGVALPTSTVASKYLNVGLKYNSQAVTWDCIATAQEA